MRIIERCIIANIFSVKKDAPHPLDAASNLQILCKYTIYVFSIKDLLGPGETYTLKLKLVITLWKYNCIYTCFYDVQLDKI